MTRPAVGQPSAQVRLLSFSATIVDCDDRLLHQLRAIYPDASRHTGDHASDETPPCRVIVDASMDAGPAGRRALIGQLEESIDTAAIANLSRHVIVHAAVVCRNGRGIVIPAASGAGKSTLVAAASLSGFTCLSDEIAIVDVATGAAWPYRKSICLKPGGWDLIHQRVGMAPSSVLVSRPDGSRVRFLPPPAMLPAGASHPVTHVVVPQRRTGERATLNRITRRAGLAELVRHSINLPRHGPSGFNTLADLVEGASCHAMTYDDLSAAVSMLIELSDG